MSVFFSDIVVRELSEGPLLRVVTSETRALAPGSAVWVAGLPGGRVTGVRFRDPGGTGQKSALIRIRLGTDAAEALQADASAQIRASSLLGPTVVALTPGRSERPFDFDDTLRAEPPLESEDVMARADSLVGPLRELQPLADSLGRRLTQGPGTLASLRADEELRDDLRRAGELAEVLAERIPRGTAARMTADTALRDALARIQASTRTLAAASEDAGAQRDSLRRQLEILSSRLDDLGEGLEAGRGTWGRLLHDGALGRERRTLEARMDSVMVELLADPFRWLRFRLY